MSVNYGSKRIVVGAHYGLRDWLSQRVTAAVNAGLVWNNCFFVRDLRQAFGGNGKSGIGREGGTWSFDFYCDVKNSVFAPTGWRK